MEARGALGSVRQERPRAATGHDRLARPSSRSPPGGAACGFWSRSALIRSGRRTGPTSRLASTCTVRRRARRQGPRSRSCGCRANCSGCRPARNTSRPAPSPSASEAARSGDRRSTTSGSSAPTTGRRRASSLRQRLRAMVNSQVEYADRSGSNDARDRNAARNTSWATPSWSVSGGVRLRISVNTGRW